MVTFTVHSHMQCVFWRFCRPQICSLMRGGIAERGGVRVGHRIIEINGQSVVAMAHEKIVQTLSVSVGEVRTPLDTRCPVSLITAPDKHIRGAVHRLDRVRPVPALVITVTIKHVSLYLKSDKM